MSGKKSTISWGRPAQIADSKDGLHCGRCGAKQGVYGKHFGIGPDGNPVPTIGEQAFDITQTKTLIATLCWNCGFSFYQILKENNGK